MRGTPEGGAAQVVVPADDPEMVHSRHIVRGDLKLFCKFESVPNIDLKKKPRCQSDHRLLNSQ